MNTFFSITFFFCFTNDIRGEQDIEGIVDPPADIFLMVLHFLVGVCFPVKEFECFNDEDVGYFVVGGCHF